jgi:hypothetical protein
LTTKLAATPLNFTDVAPLKCSPAIVTADPTAADPGERLEIVGATLTVLTVKTDDEVALPAGVVTAI